MCVSVMLCVTLLGESGQCVCECNAVCDVAR